MRQAEELAGHVSDAETGQRGFLLTNEERYLEPYRDGRAGVERDTSVLRALSPTTTRASGADSMRCRR